MQLLIFNLYLYIFHLLCHLRKSEADQVVVTVMEVFQEEQSVR